MLKLSRLIWHNVEQIMYKSHHILHNVEQIMYEFRQMHIKGWRGFLV